MNILRRIKRYFIKSINEKEKKKLRGFGKSLLLNYDDVISRIQKKKKVMIINSGEWNIEYFSVAYLNNLIKLIMFSLSKDCIPFIEVGEENKDVFRWTWFFKQPCDLILQKDDCDRLFFKQSGFRIKNCSIKTTSYGPEWWDYIDNNDDYRIWKFFYEKFVVLNDSFTEYVNKEELKLGGMCDSLGVLIRGTDYLSLKPKNHPVQPTMDEMIDAITKCLANSNIKKIYVATEEKRIFDSIANEFEMYRVCKNKRTFYDNVYEENKLINTVKFNRENDNYIKSIEYLSSLILLTRCSSFIAGNCGGTKFVNLFPNNIKDRFIFNKGLY